MVNTDWSLTLSFTDSEDEEEEEKKEEEGEKEEEKEGEEEEKDEEKEEEIEEEKEEEKEEEEKEEKEEQQQQGEEGNEDLGSFNVSDFVDKGDDGVRETVEKNVDKELGFSSAVDKNEQEGLEKDEEDPGEFERKSEQLKEEFIFLKPVIINTVLRQDDVKGNLERVRQKLQKFQDTKNPADVFKNPAERRPLITKPKGKFEDPLTHGPIKQAWVAGDKSSGGPEHESNRGKKNRSRPREKNQTQGQHGDAERQDERRNGCDSDKSDQNERNQACRGQWFDHQNAFPSQRGRGNQRGLRGCFRQVPIAGNQDYLLYKSQERHFGDEGNSQPQMGRGGQSGRGPPPKPKPKPKRKGRGHGGGRGGKTIQQVPVCKSTLFTGFSDITHDFIELYFESRRNGGGPVEKVHHVPKSSQAVVVFQDAKGL